MRRLRLLRAPLATLLTTLFLGVVMGLLAPGALAHGDLVDGTPGPGDSLAPGGEVVALEFDELAEDGRTLIAILDAGGEPIAVGAAQTTADARVVCASTSPLESGVHTLEYSVTSNDGDLIRGKYSFEVNAEGDSADSADSDITAACTDLSLDPAGEAQTLDEMGTGGFPTFLPYLLAALLVVALALVVRRIRADRTLESDSSTGEGETNREGAPDPQL